MAYKWICTKCGEKADDSLPDDPKLARNATPINYHGVCPLCQGPLKAIKKPKAKK